MATASQKASLKNLKMDMKLSRNNEIQIWVKARKEVRMSIPERWFGKPCHCWSIGWKRYHQKSKM